MIDGKLHTSINSSLLMSCFPPVRIPFELVPCEMLYTRGHIFSLFQPPCGHREQLTITVDVQLCVCYIIPLLAKPLADTYS